MSVASHIASQRTDHGVPHAVSCRALGVSESWFYKWHRRPATPRQRRRIELTSAIREAFEASGRTYGSPACARRPARGELEGDQAHRRQDHGRAGQAAPAALGPGHRTGIGSIVTPHVRKDSDYSNHHEQNHNCRDARNPLPRRPGRPHASEGRCGGGNHSRGGAASAIGIGRRRGRVLHGERRLRRIAAPAFPGPASASLELRRDGADSPRRASRLPGRSCPWARQGDAPPLAGLR